MEFQVIRHHFPEIDSTNTWAKKQINSFDRSAVTVVSADRQTAGRGQLGRVWHSPAGNLCATFCFFWKGQNVLNIPQLLALIVVEILEDYDVKAKIKWPNDLLVDKRKIGGILCETVDCNDVKGIVLGIGLNIGLSKKELAAIDQPCCSLQSLGVHEVSPQDLLENLIARFIPALQQLKDSKQLYFLDRYRSKLVHLKGDSLKGGVFEAIDEEGFLVLRKGENIPNVNQNLDLG